MIGAGFMLDMVVKVRENLSALPSRKNDSSKFLEKKRFKYNNVQNGQKLIRKEISENELNKVINNLKLSAKKEKRKQNMLILPLKILISVLILLVILFALGQLSEWYLSGGKEYLRR